MIDPVQQETVRNLAKQIAEIAASAENERSKPCKHLNDCKPGARRAADTELAQDDVIRDGPALP